MTNLLILAAGEGSRNAMFTYNNAMPKCLMSVGDKTCLEAIMASYDGLVDNVYIAVQSKHAKIVEDILRYKKSNAIIVGIEPQSCPIASLEAAVAGIENFADNNWYINWSDVFAKKMPIVRDCTIFVDKHYIHRNLAYHNNSVHVVTTDNQKGNVPGIFFASGYEIKKLLAYNMITGGRTTYDLDVLMSIASYIVKPNIVQLEDITDVGDYQKYSDYMLKNKQENTCRYFNSLTFSKSTVAKRPITEKGIALHDIELAYYRRFGDSCKAFAKLLSYMPATKTMTLERIKGRTCQSAVDAKLTDKAKLSTVNKLIKRFTEAVEPIHNLQNINVVDSEQDVLAAIIDEFYDKIDERVLPCYSAIQSVIEANDIRSIDGLPIVDYEVLKSAVKKWLDDAIANDKFKLGITHGDPNTDNTMIANDGTIRFVDPRGYFGKLKTLGYGVTMYDYAKFVYGFSGYGRFNSAEFITADIVDGDAQIYIGASESSGMADVPIFDINVSDDIKILVGIIWVKLTSYIINDPMKSVAAYLYGNAILTKLLKLV